MASKNFAQTDSVDLERLLQTNIQGRGDLSVSLSESELRLERSFLSFHNCSDDSLMRSEIVIIPFDEVAEITQIEIYDGRKAVLLFSFVEPIPEILKRYLSRAVIGNHQGSKTLSELLEDEFRAHDIGYLWQWNFCDGVADFQTESMFAVRLSPPLKNSELQALRTKMEKSQEYMDE